MKHIHRFLVPAALLAGVLSVLAVTSACGDDDDDDTATGTSTPAVTAASPTTSEATKPAVTATQIGGTSGSAQKIDVTAKDFAFDPEKITLNKSASGGAAGSVNVSFSNTGRASHTFTLYSDKDYKTKIGGAEIPATPGGGSGASVFVAPTAATTYFFRCEIHTTMQGTIEFK